MAQQTEVQIKDQINPRGLSRGLASDEARRALNQIIDWTHTGAAQASIAPWDSIPLPYRFIVPLVAEMMKARADEIFRQYDPDATQLAETSR